jgi:dipeptidyl aminopeptidase/acylaminoacyl peptidase
MFSNSLFCQNAFLIDQKPINYKDYPIRNQVDSFVLNGANPIPKKEYEFIDSVQIYHIRYYSDSLKICGFLVQPKKPGKYPCIIYNRGGNRDYGNLLVGTAVGLAKLASQGYVVIASAYRGNKCSEGKDEFGGKDVNDVMALFDILGGVASADTSKIGMIGWSRGGMMTYLALSETKRVKVAAIGGGLADLEDAALRDVAWEEKVLKELIPNYSILKRKELARRSVINWPCKISTECNILILHGGKDEEIPVSQSVKLSEEFNKCSVPNKLVIFDDDNHILSKHRREADEMILKWFKTYLQ